jgi:DNA replication protein DnaC
MLINHSLEKLRQLKLQGMASAFERQLEQANMADLSFEERFGLLVDMEKTFRENKRLASVLKEARMKYQACIEEIDWRAKRGLDKAQMLALASCDWIKAHQNICLIGPCGTGKTWLSCALGNAAARQGFTVQYVRAPRLFENFKLWHLDGSIAKSRAKLAKMDLLIIDDFGIDQLGRAERQDLLEIIEDRYLTRSTIIAGQLPIEHWHAFINDPTIADAVMDRIIHNAHKICLKGDGESMRKVKIKPDPNKES